MPLPWQEDVRYTFTCYVKVPYVEQSLLRKLFRRPAQDKHAWKRIELNGLNYKQADVLADAFLRNDATPHGEVVRVLLQLLTLGDIEFPQIESSPSNLHNAETNE